MVFWRFLIPACQHQSGGKTFCISASKLQFAQAFLVSTFLYGVARRSHSWPCQAWTSLAEVPLNIFMGSASAADPLRRAW